MAGGQAVREPSSAQVVDVRVHDHRASQDVVRADQRDERVLEIEQGHARVVPVYVAQVSGVSRLVLRTAVFFLGGKIKKKSLYFFFLTRRLPRPHSFHLANVRTLRFPTVDYYRNNIFQQKSIRFSARVLRVSTTHTQFRSLHELVKKIKNIVRFITRQRRIPRGSVSEVFEILSFKISKCPPPPPPSNRRLKLRISFSIIRAQRPNSRPVRL